MRHPETCTARRRALATLLALATLGGAACASGGGEGSDPGESGTATYSAPSVRAGGFQGAGSLFDSVLAAGALDAAAPPPPPPPGVARTPARPPAAAPRSTP